MEGKKRRIFPFRQFSIFLQSSSRKKREERCEAEPISQQATKEHGEKSRQSKNLQPISDCARSFQTAQSDGRKPVTTSCAETGVNPLLIDDINCQNSTGDCSFWFPDSIHSDTLSTLASGLVEEDLDHSPGSSINFHSVSLTDGQPRAYNGTKIPSHRKSPVENLPDQSFTKPHTVATREERPGNHRVEANAFHETDTHVGTRTRCSESPRKLYLMPSGDVNRNNIHRIADVLADQKDLYSPMHCQEMSPTKRHMEVSPLRIQTAHQVSAARVVRRPMLKPPRVFITYAEEPQTQGHCKLICSIAESLLAEGIIVHLDIFESIEMSPSITNWLDSKIDESDFVIPCISPNYKALLDCDSSLKSSPHSLQTRYVYNRLLTDYVDNRCLNRSFIPILVGGAERKDSPNLFKDTTIYEWPKDKEAIVFRLYKKERYTAPKLGAPPLCVLQSHITSWNS